jgi:hypothetical protein
MSDSAGSAPTFTESANPTAGLQPYDIERGTKNLYPGPRVGRFRHAGKRRRGHMRKGTDMDAIEAMVGTLSTSVADLIRANPPNIDELLEKNFGEFKAVLTDQIGNNVAEQIELAKADMPILEEPLYKGLGCVGRVANLVSSIVSQVQALREGGDYYRRDDDKDPASEDVATMLDHLVDLATLTLRAAVNEHVGVADDDDMENPPDGMHLILLPTAEDPDNEDDGVVVKTALPEDLAKFALDPGLIGQGIVQIGAGLMLDGGVPEQTLSKLFEIDSDPLRKNFPPKKPAASGSSGSNAPADPSIDPGASTGSAAPPDDSGDGMDDAGSDDGSGDNPLTVLGRILAAAMIQLDHIQQIVDGPDADDGQDMDDGSEQDSAGNPTMAMGNPSMGKSVQQGGLSKAASAAASPPAAPAQQPLVDDLQKQVNDLKGQLAKLLAQPAPPKGIANPVVLSKTLDTGGMPPSEEAELQKLAAQIDRLPVEQRQAAMAQELIKMQLRKPQPATGAGALSGTIAR